MGLPTIVEDYLKRHRVEIDEHAHPKAYTAHRLAEVEQLSESSVVKVVFFFCDDELVMGLLPADRHLNIRTARVETNSSSIRMASEAEISPRVGGLELGAIPPFGSLFGLPVLMDEALMKNEMLVMPAGSPTHSLKLKLSDYVRQENPRVLHLSRKPIRDYPGGKQRDAGSSG